MLLRLDITPEKSIKTSRYLITYLDAFKEVHVVLGSPACDLDSCFIFNLFMLLVKEMNLNRKSLNGRTCIIHAQSSLQTFLVISNEEFRTIIPVLNIPKEDFLLRTEVVSFLSSQDLDETLLIFRDDIDLSTLAAGSRLKLTLVDHNVLSREDADQLDPCIVQIIDHHDNGRVEEEGREIDIQLEPVGSCTTLVLADILKKSEELLDERIAALAIGTILLDTVNLSTTAGRTTDKDTRVVYTLSRHCPNLLHQEVFDALQKSKFDVTGLSAMDVLRKDFKSVSDQDTTIGLSSIPCSIEEDEMRAKLTSHLTSDAAGLQLEEQSVDCKDLSSFHHGNVGASRKVVLPLVQQFLEEVGVTNQSTTGDEQKPEDRRADGESSVETEDGGSEMKVVDTADLLGSFEPSSQIIILGCTYIAW
ncbi:hypothetical protein BSL78_29041 [Apostichopus japonicus]|uniref:DHHA2 domain-containing protein n=1 Tax=Stichopus japonicus TaxID=307972 RepID=A0A2G8JEI8_STIJA|nr:hypothetical protein BSL78_29041 [Apostichopus japonicus]